MIIYLHGFGSHGNAKKANMFREYFRSIGVGFIAPTLSYIPKLAIDTLSEIIDVCDDDIYLIGSSLGGYYSTYLSNNKKVKKVILINPAVKSPSTLKKALNRGICYYDNSEFEFTTQHIEYLKSIEPPHIDEQKFMVFLQKGDEVLDYRDAKNRYKNSKLIIQNGGNHSFENIQNHFDTIREFFGISALGI